MADEKEVMRKRSVKIKGGAFLQHLAQYDPNLAEELAISDKPLEQVVAEEITFAKMIKHRAISEMDVETLLVAFDFWNQVMERALQYFTNANAMFMMNFLQQYEYVASAVAQKLGGREEERKQPSPREIMMFKMMELFDDIRKNFTSLQQTISQPYQTQVTPLKEEKEEKKEEEEGGEEKEEEVYEVVWDE